MEQRWKPPCMRALWVVAAMGCVSWMGDAWAGVKQIAAIKGAHCEHPKWSPSGRWLSFEADHRKKHKRTLQILDVNGMKTEIIRPGVLLANAFSLKGSSGGIGVVSQNLAWAPKGKKYLFSSNRAGSVFHLFLSGSGVVKCSSRSQTDDHPSFSAEGQYVVWSSRRSGDGDIYMVNLHDSKLKAKRITSYKDSTELYPTWSPKAPHSFAYLRHTGQHDHIYLIDNVYSPTSKRLTRWRRRSDRKNLTELRPSWSPDGKQIAFYTSHLKTNRYDLYVVEAKSGSTPKKLAKNVINQEHAGPSWSPDGKSIFYVQKLRKNRDAIYRIDVSTRRRKRINTGTVANQDPVIAARGGKWHLAFSALGRKGSTNVKYRKLYLMTLPPR